MEQMEESSRQRGSPGTTPCFSFLGFSVFVKYFGLAMVDGLALVPVKEFKVPNSSLLFKFRQKDTDESSCSRINAWGNVLLCLPILSVRECILCMKDRKTEKPKCLNNSRLLKG